MRKPVACPASLFRVCLAPFVAILLVMALSSVGTTNAGSSMLGWTEDWQASATEWNEEQAQSSDFELIGHIGGGSHAVAVQGDYTYLGVGPRLVILDTSDPYRPAMVGQTDVLPDFVLGVVISGTYAYIANDRGALRVVDVSDVSNPHEVAVFGQATRAKGLAIRGTYAYVVRSYMTTAGVYTVDITDPTAPIQAGYLSFYPAGGGQDITIFEDYAYVASGSSGLRILRISDSGALSYAGYYDTSAYAKGVAADGTYAYVADGIHGLHIINVTDPSSPRAVGHFRDEWDEGYNGVEVAGIHAYVAGDYGLSIIDVSDPTQPNRISRYYTEGVGDEVLVTGTDAYVASGTAGLRVVDISTPGAPFGRISYDVLGDPRATALSGNYAYVADCSSGFSIVDVQEPANPHVVSSPGGDGCVRDIEVVGNHAYVADDYAGLRIIDIAYPQMPYEVASVDYRLREVEINGNYAYIIDTGSNLHIVDVSDPTAPIDVGTCGTLRANSISVAGTYVYVVDNYGLHVLDVSNPGSCEEVAYLDTSGAANGVAVAGSYVYVAQAYGYDGRLRIVNVSDPSAPEEVGFIDTPSELVSVIADGNYAYTTQEYLGHRTLRVIDVSDPTAPVDEITYHDTSGDATGLTAAADHLFVADGSGGLLILKHQETGYSISGAAADSSGNPLAGVSVSDGAGHTTSTDAAGKYVLNLSSGTYVLRPAKLGYAFTPEAITVEVDVDRSGADFLGEYIPCDPLGASIAPNAYSTTHDYACAMPAVAPFLEFPLPQYRTPEDFAQHVRNAYTEGGLLTSWFDHHTPIYRNPSSDVQLYTARIYSTTPGFLVNTTYGLYCWDGYCYDNHNGIDIASPMADVCPPIYAAAEGTVVAVCTEGDLCRADGSCGPYGKQVWIDHGNNYATQYAHLSTVWVEVGQPVTPDTALGWMGSTGDSTGAHLHFGVYLNWTLRDPWITTICSAGSGEVVDPFGWKGLTLPTPVADPWKTPPSVNLWEDAPEITSLAEPSGGQLASPSGFITADIPAGALADTTLMSLYEAPVAASSADQRSSGLGFWLQGLWDWIASDSTTPTLQTSAGSLLAPITVTVDYAAGALAHLDVAQLVIQRWDEMSESWQPLETDLDSAAQTAKAQTIELGAFDLQAPLICSEDTLEPNDWYPMASTLSTENPVQTLFDIPNDEDWFCLDAVAGTTYTIQTFELAVGTDTIVEVYDTDAATLLSQDNDGGGGLASKAVWTAPASRLFYVRVRSAATSVTGCDAHYTLSASQQAATLDQHIYLPLVLR